MKKYLSLSIILITIIANLFVMQIILHAQDNEEKTILKGTIEGRVIDGNGQPLANAQIFARAISTAAFSGALNTTTDEKGHFLLEGITSGNYALRAYSAGYVMETVNSDDGIYYRAGDKTEITLLRGGVITGTVTNTKGEPVIGMPVAVTYLKDAKGKKAFNTANFSPAFTDDRGVYRIYGLRAGEYLVSTGNKVYDSTGLNEDQPVYYPGTTKSQAKSVLVNHNDEVGNIDIRYNNIPGYQINGFVTGISDRDATETSLGISLVETDSGFPVDDAYAIIKNGKAEFSFAGIANGNYDLFVKASNYKTQEAYQTPVKHVQVKNNNINDIELSLIKLSYMEGHITKERLDKNNSKLSCPGGSKLALNEILINAQNNKVSKEFSSLAFNNTLKDKVADNKGNFKIEGIQAGLYFLSLNIPNKGWYLDTITKDDENATQKPVEKFDRGIPVSTGNSITKLNIKVTEGAARIEGQIDNKKSDGEKISNDKISNDKINNDLQLIVHLIPVDKNLSDNLLRYYQVAVDDTGHFLFEQIAPGKYWAIALAKQSFAKESKKVEKVEENNINDEAKDKDRSKVAWDDLKRPLLRDAAEKANNIIEIAQCQSIEKIKLPISTIKKEPVKPKKPVK